MHFSISDDVTRMAKVPRKPALAVVPARPIMRKKVRLVVIKKGPYKDNTIDKYGDSKLVDSPRKIVYEKTTLAGITPLSMELEEFYREICELQSSHVTRAREVAEEFMDFLYPRLAKMAGSYALRLRGFEVIGSAIEELQVLKTDEVDVLVLFDGKGCKFESVEPGYKVCPLRRFRPTKAVKRDPHRFGRSSDRTYLSCMRIAGGLHELIEKCLRSHPDAHLHPFMVSDGASQLTITTEKHRINIIPATYLAQEQCYMVTRPYTYDDNPKSDMLWRICHASREKCLLQRVCSADRGVRRKAVLILKALIQIEHTLQGLLSYHIKTALMHSIDADIDHTPRWQRGSLEDNIWDLLRWITHCFAIRRLPNFFLYDCNLLTNIPERTVDRLRDRLIFLMSNPGELQRILRKRWRDRLPSARVTTDSGTASYTPDWPDSEDSEDSD